MPRFDPGTSVTTREPTITVDGGLAAGTYTFRLVVIDSSGNKSAPAEVKITVKRPLVFDPTRPPLEPIQPVQPPFVPIQPIQPIPIGPTPIIRPRGRGKKK